MRHQGQADGGMNYSRPRRNPDQTVHVSTCKSLINSCKIIVYTWEGWAEKRGTQTHQRPYIGLLALVISCWTGPFDFLDGSLMAMCVFRLVPGVRLCSSSFLLQLGLLHNHSPAASISSRQHPSNGTHSAGVLLHGMELLHHQVGKH